MTDNQEFNVPEDDTVNISTGDAHKVSHFHYRLDACAINKSMDDTFNRLQEYSSKISEINVQNRNDPGKTQVHTTIQESENSCIHDFTFGRKKAKDIEEIINSKTRYKEKKVIFEVVSVDELRTLLQKYKERLMKNEVKLLAIIIDTGGPHWVALVVTFAGKKWSGFHVDSSESEISNVIEREWKTFNNKHVDITDFTEIFSENDKESLIFAFQNAETIVEYLSGSNEDIENKIKKRFKQKYYVTFSFKKYRDALEKQLIEKNKIEDKIRVCSKFLAEINEKGNSETFSYKHANAFTFFIETIALEGYSRNMQTCLDVFKDIFGKENNALCKEIRRLLLHSDYVRNIRKENLETEMKKLIKHTNFKSVFEYLGLYMSEVQKNLQISKRGNRINGEPHFNLNECMKCKNDIENMHENRDFGDALSETEVRKVLEELFRTSIKQIGSVPDVVNGEEIMFNLTVNIIPILENRYCRERNSLQTTGLEEIRKFRNDILHNFHVHDNPLQRNFEFKKGMRSLLDYFFKFYFSQRIYEKFKLLATSSSAEIKNEMELLLKDAQRDFMETYLTNDNSLSDPAIIELESGKGVGNKLKISDSVRDYLKLMCVIDNEYVTHEREENRKKQPVVNRELTAVDRKRICNKFKELKELHRNNENTEKGETPLSLIEDMREKLQCDGIWIKSEYLKSMIESYVKTQPVAKDSQLDKLIGIVCNDASALISIKTDYKVLSSVQNVVDIYDKRIEYGNFNHLHEFGLTKEQLSSILKKLSNLQSLQERFVDLSLDIDVKNKEGHKIHIKVDAAEQTSNFVQMLDEHVLYPFLSMDIVDIFNDNIFIDYLIHENVFGINENLIKILEETYVTPYVVELVIRKETEEKNKDEEKNKAAKKKKAAEESKELLLTEDVFSTIVKNLLSSKIYSEYLKKILGINGDYSDKYKIVSKHIHMDNVQNLFCLFKISEHVSGIFGALLKHSIELQKLAFGLLKNAIDELYLNGKHDEIIELWDTKEVDSIKEILLKNDSSDLYVLQVQHTLARTENRKGSYEKSIAILNSMKDMILTMEKSSDVEIAEENIDPVKVPFYFLTLSDIAYTKHMLGRCEESHNEYKYLYNKMTKYLGIVQDVKSLSYEIYNRILESEKYRDILQLNTKYLNILHIGGNIAYELRCLANKKKQSLPSKYSRNYTSDLNEVCRYYQEALDIFENIYRIKGKEAVFNKSTIKTMREIAFASNILSDLKSKKGSEGKRIFEACWHNKKTFDIFSMILENRMQDLWVTHPAVPDTVDDVLYTLNKMAYLQNELSRLKLVEDELRFAENALDIYEKNYPFHKAILGEEHEYTLKVQSGIAFTNNRIALLKSKHKPEDSIQYYDKAIAIYKKVLDIQKRTHGPQDESTLKTKTYLNNTEKWKMQLHDKTGSKRRRARMKTSPGKF